MDRNYTKASQKRNLPRLLFKKIKPGLCTLTLLLAVNITWAQIADSTKIHPLFRRMLLQEQMVKKANLAKGNANNNTKSAPNKITGIPPSRKVEATSGFAPNSSVSDLRYNCIVYTSNAQLLRDSGIVVNSVFPTFVTAWATAEQMVKMSSMASVKYIDAPKTRKINNDVARGNSGAALLGAGALNNTKYTGKGVIVGILDTGIDWDLLDFRDTTDPTKSRILRIWDQVDDTSVAQSSSYKTPTGFNYGVEYTQAQINSELGSSPANYVREKDLNGHGTHVAGTAIGNGASLASKQYKGMAPDADIVIIKGGNGSFSSNNIADGISYLQSLATTLGEPVVLNMSLGGQSSAHDGTDPEDIAVDNFTGSAAGRAAVIAAGNDNGNALHKQISLGSGATVATTIAVPSTTTATDVFDFLTYSSDNSNISVTVTAPGGNTATANAGTSTATNVISSGFTVYIYNQTDAGNSDRYVEVYVVRNGSNTQNPSGNWTISFKNNTTNTPTLNGWLDDTGPGCTLAGGDNNQLVGSPGDATSAITVGAYVGKFTWYSASTTAPGGYAYTSGEQDSIATFSSHGPRRDNVLKPEITAPGQAMVSCLSSDAGLAPSDPNVVVQGLYRVEQGTSMATPTVAGCVALLLQANPSITSSALKSAITSTASSDAFTNVQGALPNTTWGYGRLDAFKAASSLFANCTQANRKTYKYDNSVASGIYSLGTGRVAVKLTPDITGNLGGIFFDAGIAMTSTLVEVRTSISGYPGTLLGSLNIDSASISKYAFNYFDLSSLNIPVTSGTDYFIVLARAVNKSSTWTLIANTPSIGNSTSYSTDGGSTWNPINYNFWIRPVVYSTAQLAATNIASATSSDTRGINTSNQFINSSCGLIATVNPSGTTPISGSVTSTVTVEAAPIQYGNGYFVQRHYDISPVTNAANATAWVTLYFTQAEFTAFNNQAGHGLNLPTSSSDATGIGNIRIAQYHGTSSSGTPSGYSGSSQIIDPVDSNIQWNAANNRWEIGFAVTGFSGFYLQTSATILPITLLDFTAKLNNDHNTQLNWATSSEYNNKLFEIELSRNGADFVTLGTVASKGNTTSLQNYTYLHVKPEPGISYYRLKQIDVDGKFSYSKIISVNIGENGTEAPSLYPVPAHGTITVNFGSIVSNCNITIYSSDMKPVLSQSVNTISLRKDVDISLLPNGIYFVKISGGLVPGLLKFIKQ